MKPILMLLTLLLSFSVFSQSDVQEKRKASCSDVVNLNPPLERDKPRNQDTIGWCYAYAAADLLGHALGKNVSAVSLAASLNDKPLFRILGIKEGGFIDAAISETMKKGFCLEKDLPSEDYLFSLSGRDISTTFYSLLAFVKNLRK